jgi:hypothetical protein
MVTINVLLLAPTETEVEKCFVAKPGVSSDPI